MHSPILYKFRRLTIGQNCRAVCTNEVAKAYGAIQMHSRAQASGASAARFNRPARQATEPRAKRDAMSALCHGLVIDSTSSGVRTSPLHCELRLASSEGCGLHLRMRAILTYSMLLVVFSHDCDIKHTCTQLLII